MYDQRRNEQLRQQVEYIKGKLENNALEDYQSDSDESIKDGELEYNKTIDAALVNKYQKELHILLLNQFTINKDIPKQYRQIPKLNPMKIIRATSNDLTEIQ